MIDVISGLYAFQSMLVALYSRRENGQGCYIDCSLLQAATAFQTLPLLLHSAGARGDSTLNSSPIGTFKTSDGWINLVVSKDSLWPGFCGVINRPDLANDATLAKAEQRRSRRSEVTAAVTAALAQDTSNHWSDRLNEIGVMNEPVNDYEGLLHHPQIEAIDAISWVEQPGLGRIAVANPPGAPALESGTPRAITPALGADTRDILAEIGYEQQQIDSLIASGAAASPPLKR